MLFPRDDEKRYQWMAAAMVGAYNYWREHGAPESVLSDFHGWLSATWEFKQSPQRVLEDGEKRTQRAALSGHILLRLIALARHHPERCKLEQAKEIVSQFAPRDGSSISNSLLNKVWAEFQGVSHLWATMVLKMKEEMEGAIENSFWAEFLGISEAIRKDALQSRLVSPDLVWEAPDQKDIPLIERVEVEPLPADMLDILQAHFPS